MSTGQDLIQGALLNINAFAPGQPLSSSVASVALDALNDLLDSLSTDQAFVYTQIENIFQWTGGQYKYTVGNPIAGFFLGTVTGTSNVITGVAVPSNLVQYATLTDLSGSIPLNTTVSSIGAASVIMSQAALFNVAGLDQVTYTAPGQIILNTGLAMERPLRIRSGYTRVTGGLANGLDYWFDCQNTMDRYNEIGFKGVPGPWPYLLTYQPTIPLGTFWVYPTPSASNEVHLFTDAILQKFTLTVDVSLPQGYGRALKKLLAVELCPIFGKTPSPALLLQAKEAKGLIKAHNASPITTLRYDSDLVYSRHTDAGWIISGGFT